MVNRPVWVNPIYGWGWTDGHEMVDTPERFLAFVIRDMDELVGVIQSGDLKNRQIRMSKTLVGPFAGDVNVKIRSDLGEQLFGWASISKDLME